MKIGSDDPTSRATRRKREVQQFANEAPCDCSGVHGLLVAQARWLHKPGVTVLFDPALRRTRRNRAAGNPELFLLDRAFEDCIDRLGMIQRRFTTALLLGCPNPQWPDALRKLGVRVDVFDPGERFASLGGGTAAEELSLPVEPATYDLVITVGMLDTCNDLPGALLRLRFALREDGLLLGAMSGGETLPLLRSAMRAVDHRNGAAAPHVHPRISPAALSTLLTDAGLAMPVVDVDRVRVRYSSLEKLVRDLRSMAATNILVERSRRALNRGDLGAASEAFLNPDAPEPGLETFEILHFAGWAPAPARA